MRTFLSLLFCFMMVFMSKAASFTGTSVTEKLYKPISMVEKSISVTSSVDIAFEKSPTISTGATSDTPLFCFMMVFMSKAASFTGTSVTEKLYKPISMVEKSISVTSSVDIAFEKSPTISTGATSDTPLPFRHQRYYSQYFTCTKFDNLNFKLASYHAHRCLSRRSCETTSLKTNHKPFFTASIPISRSNC